MKLFMLKYWPIAVIFFVWFVFGFPYFFQNKTPYPASFQNAFFSPWSEYKEFAVPVKNNALSDVVTQIYPWKHFTIEELKKGNIPHWNPFSFSGNVHLADFQTAVFSPFNLLFFVLPFNDAWSLLILLQPLLAGLFMNLFLRKIKISKEGSLIGSIAYMFCGFIVVWMPYGTLSMSISFLPLALYAVSAFFEKRKLTLLILLTVSLVFSFFSGHFQISLYMAVYVFIFIIYLFLVTKKVKEAVLLLLFYLLGILISLFQIIPSLQIYELSVRSGLFSNSGAIPFYHLLTAAVPDFFGNPVTRNDWMGNYAEWASFIGIVSLSMALLAIFQIKDVSAGRREKINIMFFFTAGMAAVILAIDTPLQGVLIMLKLPVFSTSIPSRIIVLFCFSFAVLAGYGLDYLRVNLEKKKFKKLILINIVLICSIFTACLLLPAFKIMPEDKLMVAVRNLIIPTLFLLIVTVLIIAGARIKKFLPVKVILYCLIILAIADSLRFAQKWMPYDSKELIFPEVPVISAMQKNIGSGRVFGKFGSYIDTYYRLPSIEGYDPLYIRRYGEFLASAKNGLYTPGVKSLAVLDKRAKHASRVLDLLGVSVLFHVIGDTGKDWAYPVWQKDKNDKYLHSVIYQDENFQLYDNKTALPRAKVFYKYEVIKEDRDIIKRFYSESFDFRNILILEEDPGMKMIDKAAIGSRIKVASYTPDKIEIDVMTPQDGLLFLSDSYYPNWEAYIDGKRTKIYRADYAFRAILVKKGKSKVEYVFRANGITKSF